MQSQIGVRSLLKSATRIGAPVRVATNGARNVAFNSAKLRKIPMGYQKRNYGTANKGSIQCLPKACGFADVFIDKNK
jgi:hypothetical protein